MKILLMMLVFGGVLLWAGCGREEADQAPEVKPPAAIDIQPELDLDQATEEVREKVEEIAIELEETVEEIVEEVEETVEDAQQAVEDAEKQQKMLEKY